MIGVALAFVIGAIGTGIASAASAAPGVGQAANPTTTTQDRDPLSWPEPSEVTRPWTRWWWHGSAVTDRGITEAP